MPQTPALPPGFVLDEPAGSGSPPPPPGFVLDAQPAPRGRWPAPQHEVDVAGPASRGWRFADDLVRSAAQGITFGTADEIAAAAGSTVGAPIEDLTGLTSRGGEGGTYEEILASQRAADEEISPGTQLVGGLAGGVLAGAGLPRLAAAAAPAAVARLSPIAQKIPGWLRAMGVGGAGGAAYGFGSGEGGLENRLEGAKAGAVLGAAAGPVVYGGASALKNVLAPVGQAIGEKFRPTKLAQNRVSREVANDEMTAEQVASNLQELGPQARIADAAGPNVQGLSASAAKRPGPAMTRARQALEERQAGSGERITKALDEGVENPDFYAAEDDFVKHLREQARPLYKEAYEAYPTVGSPQLSRILKGKSGQKALKATVESLEQRVEAGGDEAAEAAQALKAIQEGDFENLPLMVWDRVKQGFDDVLKGDKYTNKMTGYRTPKGRDFEGVRGAFVGALDKATGGKTGPYAKARQQFAGDAETLQALRDGRKAVNKDPEAIVRDLGRLSEGAREAYRSGAVSALKATVDKTPGRGNAAARIYGSKRFQDRLRALYPDDKDFARVQQTLKSEDRFSQLYSAGGVRSVPNVPTDAVEDIARKAGGAAALLTGSNAGLFLASMRKKLGESLVGKGPDKYGEELVRLLYSDDPAVQRETLGFLQNVAKRNKLSFGEMMALVTGQQAGSANPLVVDVYPGAVKDVAGVNEEK